MTDNDTSGGNGASGDNNQNGVSPTVLLSIAVGLLVVYLLILFLLFLSADDKGASEIVWGRYTYLLGGFEAIVFTAVGWLFGREVNRKQAEQAEEATKEAADAKAKGEGLKQAILAHPAIAGSGQESVGDGTFQALRNRAAATQF